MIDWEASKAEFGTTMGLKGNRPMVVVLCDKCKSKGSIRIRNKSLIKKTGDRTWLCRSCVNNQPNKIAKLKNASKKLWENDKYRSKNLSSVRSAENRKKLSDNWYKNMKSIVASDEYKSKQRKSSIKSWRDSKYASKIIKSSTEMWNNASLRDKMLSSRRTDKYRENQRIKAIERWQDPNYIKKQDSAKARAVRSPENLAKLRANQKKVSSIQNMLYSILDDLEVKYYREYNDKIDDHEVKIGPYNFDCLVPRDNKPDLLIECQGEYWHSIREGSDKAKASYISNNHSDKYELKYIWEHEFHNKNRVVELVKYWLGIAAIDSIEFDFDSVEIRKCPPKDYKLLLGKYHYLPTAGRGGIAFGAYLESGLIAVCIFSPMPRQNMPYNNKSHRELSRLCIHPRYQKKNFASWFVSRCIKLLPTKYKTIISYCDTTFNHDGAVYKACNFKLDGEVKPDYWYASKSGWIMHKRTMYGHATKMKKNESDYAKEMGYKKIWGSKKLRFVFDRS